MIKSIEGNAANSRGSFKYMATSKINMQNAIFNVKRISRITAGKGTMISATIPTRKTPTKISPPANRA